MQLKAVSLKPELVTVKSSGLYFAVRRFCLKHNIVLRWSTHKAQANPLATIDLGRRFLAVTRPIVNAPGIDCMFIMNMDQTPLLFLLDNGKTLADKGDQLVPYRGSGGSKDRTTECLTVCADGTKLRPMMIFKGMQDGRIARMEIPANPNNQQIEMICQPSAWQDSENMLIWIDRILVPHIQHPAQGSRVLLFLDKFSAHHCRPVKERLLELGVELRCIPGGCTWLVQPIDVVVGKPFKKHVQKQWLTWLHNNLEQYGHGNRLRASRILQSEWVKNAWESIGPTVVKNGWQKTGYQYFYD